MLPLVLLHSSTCRWTVSRSTRRDSAWYACTRIPPSNAHPTLLGYQVKKIHSHETHKIKKNTISNPPFYPSALVSHQDHRSDKTVPAYPSAAISSPPVQYEHSRLRRRNQAGNGITSAGTVQQSLDWILSALQPLGVCRVKIIGGRLTEGSFRLPDAEPSFWNGFPNP
jgi:hypothetical protein